MDKLSREEFASMVNLLKRFTSSEMDQFENWMMNTEYGKVYIAISRTSPENEDIYIDLDSCLDK